MSYKLYELFFYDVRTCEGGSENLNFADIIKEHSYK